MIIIQISESPDILVSTAWPALLWSAFLILTIVFFVYAGVRLYFRLMLYLKRKIELIDKRLNE